MKKIILLVFTYFNLHASSICIFTPPENWQIQFSQYNNKYRKISFVEKTYKKKLYPSIILSIEENVSKNYLSSVKNLHKKNNHSIKDLGDINTLSGNAHLLEISIQEDLKILQLILLKNNIAYLLTTSCDINDFPKHANDFKKSLFSLQLIDNLFDVIKDQSKKNTLIKKFNSTDKKDFEKNVFSNFKELGSYWQYLILKEYANK